MADIEKITPVLSSTGVQLDSDAAELANLGYKQEFNRGYNFLSTFSFAFSISGLMGTISITYLYPLWSGGPACAVWCWFVGALGCLCIAWSVAHITSCFPTSGGMYYTLSQVVPKEWVALSCWIDGWLYLTGVITGVTSTDFGAATLLLAIISMYSDYEYVPEKGHVTAVSILIMISHGLINSLPNDILASITQYYCIINIGSTIALIIHLLVKCPKINTADFTFNHVVNNTGWSSDGWAFLFGFLNVSWVMTCYDSASRISEEVHNAAYYTPLAIALALTVTAILGWVLVIVFTLSMGTDIDAILNSQTGQPIVAVYTHAMGKQAATAYLTLAFIIIWFTGAVACCSTSRGIWSFARDRGLPYHKFLGKVNKRTGVPLNSLWILVLIMCLLSLINLGSTVAMNAIFSACAIATDWSYVVVIGAFLLNAEKMGIKFGPFSLGKFYKPVMAYSCIWTVFLSIVFVFPNFMPVDKENMNYTIVILGAVFLGAGGWWLLGAKNWYVGPISNIDDSYAKEVKGVIHNKPKEEKQEPEAEVGTSDKGSEIGSNEKKK
ncbi:amino acid permease [Ascoidea rubescens DSM 1968]|uniref:Amino acid permease n=1 Tax=Ascoidea rubescens DSM 1968 TaxID=1344418 RepID=A0A1D2VEJ0_9ASCO|nr:amino acid permease [Ascoidea rubescens DSM 1968]ODV60029.1 amino acid permease [Ascoidea rubescens DSM 1968]